MTTRPPPTFEFESTLGPLNDRSEITDLWSKLDALSSGPFFVSSRWIVPWVEALPESIHLFLFSARQTGRVAALALLGRRRTRTGGIVPLEVLHLHATGSRPYDDLTIEFNGVLSRSGIEGAAAIALVECLRNSEHNWDECVFSLVVDGPLLERAARERGLLAERFAYQTPFVDLAEVRRRGGQYMSMLGKKVRYQLRRAQRDVEARFGELRVTAAHGAEDRLRYFRRLAELHGDHWRARGGGHAFSHPWNVAFHERVLATEAQPPCCQLLRIAAGDQEIGYIYSFVWRGIVYFYQSGFDYARIGRPTSPGILTIAAAIQYCCDAGFDRFEFMVGDHPYKSKLATHSGELHWVRISRPSTKMRAIATIRRLMRTIRLRRGRH